jgi:DNA-binding MarR family transcriptional regulator
MIPDPFDDQISAWCRRAAHAFKTIFDAECRTWGLSVAEAAVLFKLKLYGPQSLVELSRRIRHSHPTVLAQVKNLESTGYLSRSPHPEDRRVRIIMLTASGEEIVSRFSQLVNQVNERVVAQLGLREATRIANDLEHLVKVLSTLTPAIKIHVSDSKTNGPAKPPHKRTRL